MWYFSWILGIGLVCTFGILNGIWFEINQQKTEEKPPRKSRATI